MAPHERVDMRHMIRSALSLALLGLLAAGTAAAQTSYPNVKIVGRLQVEFYDFNNGDNAIYAAIPTRAAESNFLIRRARITAKGNLTENISFVIQPSYTTGQSGVILKDAYLDVAFTKPEAKSSFVLRAGQFKRFFGRYERHRERLRGARPGRRPDLHGDGEEAPAQRQHHERGALPEQPGHQQLQVLLRAGHLRHHADALDRRLLRQP